MRACTRRIRIFFPQGTISDDDSDYAYKKSVCYGAASCIKAVKNDPTVIMTLLWWALYLGIFVPTNEYWNCPGGLFMLMLMYPLLGLRNVIQKDKGERKVEKQPD